MSARATTHATALIWLTLSLAACGGGGGGGSPAPGPVTPTGQSSNPLEQPLGEAELTLSGLSEGELNPKSTLLQLDLAATNFGTSPADFTVGFVGDPNLLDPAATAVSPKTARAAINLQDGFNEVIATASDDAGRLIHLRQRVWAGDNLVTVRLQDAQGQDWLGGAEVRIALAEAPAVGAQQTLAANTAQTSFKHLPSRTVIVQAQSGLLVGETGAVAANNGVITVTLHPLDTAASTIDNNDFHLGNTSGWTTPGTATLIGHVSDAGVGAPGDNDLALSTGGLTAPQRVSRVFTTSPGTRAVTVRYRVATTEWQQLGEERLRYSDHHSIRLRSKQLGTVAADSQARVGLGESAFGTEDAKGWRYTAWRTLRLRTDPAGDTVQLDGMVANVKDAAYDSQLIIDRIEADSQHIEGQLSWDAAQGGAALALSSAAPLPADRNIQLYWARGSTLADKLGATPVAAFVMPASGIGATFPVPGTLLLNAPAGATHLVAAVDDATLAALPDVKLVAGPNANLASLDPGMIRLLTEAARSAGASSVTVAQTALSPAQQAHAMFLNLTRSTGDIASNIAAQQAIYGNEGDAVVQVFATLAQGKTLAQVLAAQAGIEAAMAAEIVRQGPFKVSAHCVDTATTSLVDVRVSSLPSATSSLFKAVVSGSRASRFAEETGLWHVETRVAP